MFRGSVMRSGTVWMTFLSILCAQSVAYNPKLSEKEKFENIVIKNVFSHEDISVEKINDDSLNEIEDSTNKIEEVIDDLEDINDSLDTIIESERDKRKHQKFIR